MGLFTRKPQTTNSPWGIAKIHETLASVTLGRFRGVCIDLYWTIGAEPSEERVQKVKDRLLEHWDAALDFLGVADFPAELPIVVPESISFLSAPDEWEITFSYPKWDDGSWTVVFRGDQPISHYEVG